MSPSIRALRGAVAAITMLMAVAAVAAEPTTRIRGTIEQVDGTALTIATREGASVRVTLTPDAKIAAMVPAELDDAGYRQLHRHGGRAAEGWPVGGAGGAGVSRSDARRRRGPSRLGPDARQHDDQRHRRGGGDRCQRPGADPDLQGRQEGADRAAGHADRDPGPGRRLAAQGRQPRVSRRDTAGGREPHARRASRSARTGWCRRCRRELPRR